MFIARFHTVEWWLHRTKFSISMTLPSLIAPGWFFLFNSFPDLRNLFKSLVKTFYCHSLLTEGSLVQLLQWFCDGKSMNKIGCNFFAQQNHWFWIRHCKNRRGNFVLFTKTSVTTRFRSKLWPFQSSGEFAANSATNCRDKTRRVFLDTLTMKPH